MNTTKAAVMITIFFSTGQGKNHYTISSINAFLLNLQKYHKITVQRRWIFYCFRWLLDEGYVRRKERYRKDGNGLITQIPSMVTFTLKGVLWLISKGVSGAKRIYKSMQKFLKSQDNRWPTRSQFENKSFWPEDPETKAGLKSLLGIVSKDLTKEGGRYVNKSGS